MEVVPNKMLMATRPGKSDLRSVSSAAGVRTSCISVQEKGKIMPQLILGGFR